MYCFLAQALWLQPKAQCPIIHHLLKHPALCLIVIPISVDVTRIKRQLYPCLKLLQFLIVTLDLLNVEVALLSLFLGQALVELLVVLPVLLEGFLALTCYSMRCLYEHVLVVIDLTFLSGEGLERLYHNRLLL